MRIHTYIYIYIYIYIYNAKRSALYKDHCIVHKEYAKKQYIRNYCFNNNIYFSKYVVDELLFRKRNLRNLFLILWFDIPYQYLEIDGKYIYYHLLIGQFSIKSYYSRIIIMMIIRLNSASNKKRIY